MDLYVNRAATTSRAVLAFVEAEGVDVELREIDLMKGEQRSPSFLAINPNGLVPVLDDEGFVLTETVAILRYLAATTDSPLYPADPKGRARVDEWTSWFEANLYKDLGYGFVYPQIFPHHARPSVEATRAAVEWGRDRSKVWLAVLDAHLRRGEGHVAGPSLTIADYLGGSIVSLGALVGCRYEAYPSVRAWLERLRDDDPWRAANEVFDGFVRSLEGKRFVELAA